MNRAALHVTLACAGGLIGGGLAGGWPWFGHAEPSKAPAASAVPAASATAPRTPSAALAEAVRTASGERRWLPLASAAEHATARDMPALIRLAGDDSSARSMLAARWAELDPKHMLATLYADFLLPDGSPAALPGRGNLTSALLESWSRRDPAAMIKALEEIPNFAGRESLRSDSARELCKNDIQLGIRAMKQWSVRDFTPDLKKFGEWVNADPAGAVDAAAWFGRDYVGRELLRQAGKMWGRTDAAAALRYASKLQPDQLAAFAEEVVGPWAARDLEAAVAFASAQENAAFRGALAQSLVKKWGKTDAAAALAWSQANLGGRARNEAIAGLIATTAEKDLHAAGTLVAGMEPGAAQDRACISLFQTWFMKGKEHHDAALEWLAELPDENTRRIAMERVQWDFVALEPEVVRDFIKGPHGKLVPDSLIHQASHRLTSKNPEQAIEWAKSLPPGKSEIALGSVLERWLYSRPDGAAEYARKLPAGSERDRAIKRVASSFAYQSPERAAEWYASLPAGDAKDKAKAAFETVELPGEKRVALDKALKGK